jgi:hypothetical protein
VCHHLTHRIASLRLLRATARDNWYHADLELSRFVALQKERGESLFKLAAKVSSASMTALKAGIGAPLPPGAPASEVWRRRTRAAQALLPLPLLAQLVLHGALSAADAQPLSRSPVAHAFLNLDVAAGMKLVLAEQLTDADGLAESLKGSVILGDRNAAAMDELRVAIRAGARRIAVLYGSAHLPDLELRIATELGLRRARTEWLHAWRVPLPRVASRAATAAAAAAPHAHMPQLRSPQAAALFGLSLMMATDLYLWEMLLRWAGQHLPAEGLFALL